MSIRESTAASDGDQAPAEFRHEAFFYSDNDEFLTGTVSFIRDGLLEGQPVLVAVLPDKIDRLRVELGPDADRVCFVDMADIGRNPARIIPELRRFVDAPDPGVKLRGIGEPIWSDRGAAELVESRLHETLLNVAFDSAPLWLRCPYDTNQLEPAIIEEARRSHPFLMHDRHSHTSHNYRDPMAADDVLAAALPPPPERPDEVVFGAGELAPVRSYVSTHAARAKLAPSRAGDLVVAVNELTTNSVRHGGGWGVLRMWEDRDNVVCEVTDQGHVSQPLAGRRRPLSKQAGQRGLWLVNQLCDLVQLRSSPAGTRVRLHMRRA